MCQPAHLNGEFLQVHLIWHMPSVYLIECSSNYRHVMRVSLLRHAVGVRVTPPMDQSVNISGTLRLTCDVSGSEPISYQWSKDGQQLQDSVRVSGSSTSVLVVEPVEGDDFGGYRCNASNDVDQVQSEVAMVAGRCGLLGRVQ